MKINLCLSIAALLLVYCGCQKEIISPAKDYAKYTKNFLLKCNSYTRVDAHYFRSVYDIVTACRVENDSLKLMSYAFLIQSDTQTIFHCTKNEASTYNTDSEMLTIRFSEDFNRVEIDYDFSNSYSISGASYQGYCSNLALSIVPHNDASVINGEYLLQANEQHRSGTVVHIDTQYLANKQVWMDQKIQVGNNEFFYSSFHSHRKNIQINEEVDILQELYCDGDSLYLNYRTIQNYTQDTLWHHYEGRKR